ncbi:protein phosphatase 2C domain-containing protein [Nocardia sp. NPDC127579]|uniref:protein phosphatase 2C domain-containing protein n=1 Tax=Nocardia sp. NPDC127579 TaxID=3345402 RepID=UPI0036392190
MSEENPNIPAWMYLLEFFEFAIGSDWPAGSSDLIEEIAAELTEAKSLIEAVYDPLDLGIGQAAQAYPAVAGGGGETIAEKLKPFAAGDASVEKLVEGFAGLVDALNSFSAQLYSANWEATITGIWFAGEIAASYAMGPGKLAGLAKAVGTARLKYGILGKVLLRAVELLLKALIKFQKLIPKGGFGRFAFEVIQESLQEVAQGAFTDLLVHNLTVAGGYKSDLNTEKFVDNAILNAIGGAGGGLTGNLASSAVNKFFPMSPANPNKWADAFKSYGVGFTAGLGGSIVANLATPYVTGQPAVWDIKSMLSGANASGIPSAVSGYRWGHTGYDGPIDGSSAVNDRFSRDAPTMMPTRAAPETSSANPTTKTAPTSRPTPAQTGDSGRPNVTNRPGPNHETTDRIPVESEEPRAGAASEDSPLADSAPPTDPGVIAGHTAEPVEPRIHDDHSAERTPADSGAPEWALGPLGESAPLDLQSLDTAPAPVVQETLSANETGIADDKPMPAEKPVELEEVEQLDTVPPAVLNGGASAHVRPNHPGPQHDRDDADQAPDILPHAPGSRSYAPPAADPDLNEAAADVDTRGGASQQNFLGGVHADIAETAAGHDTGDNAESPLSAGAEPGDGTLLGLRATDDEANKAAILADLDGAFGGSVVNNCAAREVEFAAEHLNVEPNRRLSPADARIRASGISGAEYAESLGGDWADEDFDSLDDVADTVLEGKSVFVAIEYAAENSDLVGAHALTMYRVRSPQGPSEYAVMVHEWIGDKEYTYAYQRNSTFGGGRIHGIVANHRGEFEKPLLPGRPSAARSTTVGPTSRIGGWADGRPQSGSTDPPDALTRTVIQVDPDLQAAFDSAQSTARRAATDFRNAVRDSRLGVPVERDVHPHRLWQAVDTALSQGKRYRTELFARIERRKLRAAYDACTAAQRTAVAARSAVRAHAEARLAQGLVPILDTDRNPIQGVWREPGPGPIERIDTVPMDRLLDAISRRDTALTNLLEQAAQHGVTLTDLTPDGVRDQVSASPAHEHLFPYQWWYEQAVTRLEQLSAVATTKTVTVPGGSRLVVTSPIGERALLDAEGRPNKRIPGLSNPGTTVEYRRIDVDEYGRASWSSSAPQRSPEGTPVHAPLFVPPPLRSSRTPSALQRLAAQYRAAQAEAGSRAMAVRAAAEDLVGVASAEHMPLSQLRSEVAAVAPNPALTESEWAVVDSVQLAFAAYDAAVTTENALLAAATTRAARAESDRIGGTPIGDWIRVADNGIIVLVPVGTDAAPALDPDQLTALDRAGITVQYRHIRVTVDADHRFRIEAATTTDDGPADDDSFGPTPTTHRSADTAIDPHADSSAAYESAAVQQRLRTLLAVRTQVLRRAGIAGTQEAEVADLLQMDREIDQRAGQLAQLDETISGLGGEWATALVNSGARPVSVAVGVAPGATPDVVVVGARPIRGTGPVEHDRRLTESMRVPEVAAALQAGARVRYLCVDVDGDITELPGPTMRRRAERALEPMGNGGRGYKLYEFGGGYWDGGPKVLGGDYSARGTKTKVVIGKDNPVPMVVRTRKARGYAQVEHVEWRDCGGRWHRVAGATTGQPGPSPQLGAEHVAGLHAQRALIAGELESALDRCAELSERLGLSVADLDPVTVEVIEQVRRTQQHAERLADRRAGSTALQQAGARRITDRIGIVGSGSAAVIVVTGTREETAADLDAVLELALEQHGELTALVASGITVQFQLCAAEPDGGLRRTELVSLRSGSVSGRSLLRPDLLMRVDSTGLPRPIPVGPLATFGPEEPVGPVKISTNRAITGPKGPTPDLYGLPGPFTFVWGTRGTVDPIAGLWQTHVHPELPGLGEVHIDEFIQAAIPDVLGPIIGDAYIPDGMYASGVMPPAPPFSGDYWIPYGIDADEIFEQQAGMLAHHLNILFRIFATRVPESPWTKTFLQNRPWLADAILRVTGWDSSGNWSPEIAGLRDELLVAGADPKRLAAAIRRHNRWTRLLRTKTPIARRFGTYPLFRPADKAPLSQPLHRSTDGHRELTAGPSTFIERLPGEPEAPRTQRDRDLWQAVEAWTEQAYHEFAADRDNGDDAIQQIAENAFQHPVLYLGGDGSWVEFGNPKVWTRETTGSTIPLRPDGSRWMTDADGRRLPIAELVARLSRIRDHLMHDVLHFEDGAVQPLDRVADVARAWQRLIAGAPLRGDIILLEAALAETEYLDAHSHIDSAGNRVAECYWEDANQHAKTLGYDYGDAVRAPLDPESRPTLRQLIPFGRAALNAPPARQTFTGVLTGRRPIPSEYTPEAPRPFLPPRGHFPISLAHGDFAGVDRVLALFAPMVDDFPIHQTIKANSELRDLLRSALRAGGGASVDARATDDIGGRTVRVTVTQTEHYDTKVIPSKVAARSRTFTVTNPDASRNALSPDVFERPQLEKANRCAPEAGSYVNARQGRVTSADQLRPRLAGVPFDDLAESMGDATEHRFGSRYSELVEAMLAAGPKTTAYVTELRAEADVRGAHGHAVGLTYLKRNDGGEHEFDLDGQTITLVEIDQPGGQVWFRTHESGRSSLTQLTGAEHSGLLELRVWAWQDGRNLVLEGGQLNPPRPDATVFVGSRHQPRNVQGGRIRLPRSHLPDSRPPNPAEQELARAVLPLLTADASGLTLAQTMSFTAITGAHSFHGRPATVEDMFLALSRAYPGDLLACKDLPVEYRNLANRVRISDLLRETQLEIAMGTETPATRPRLARTEQAAAALADVEARAAHLPGHPPVQVLSFDPDAVDGQGTMAIAIGDMDSTPGWAVRILDRNADFETLPSELRRAADHYAVDAMLSAQPSAVVAWLGFRVPPDSTTPMVDAQTIRLRLGSELLSWLRSRTAATPKIQFYAPPSAIPLVSDELGGYMRGQGPVVDPISDLDTAVYEIDRPPVTSAGASPEVPTQPPVSSRFPSVDDARVDDLMAALAGVDLSSPEAVAAALEQVLGTERYDAVTGSYFGGEAFKHAELERALRFVQAQRAQGREVHGYWILGDLTNLSGLNHALGDRTELVNPHLEDLAGCFHGALAAAGFAAVPMRLEGGRVAAIVLTTDPGAVEQAIIQAKAAVATYAAEQGFAEIPDPRIPDQRGVALDVGAADIGATLDTDPVADILQAADARLAADRQRRMTGDVTGEPGGPAGSDRADPGTTPSPIGRDRRNLSAGTGSGRSAPAGGAAPAGVEPAELNYPTPEEVSLDDLRTRAAGMDRLPLDEAILRLVGDIARDSVTGMYDGRRAGFKAEQVRRVQEYQQAELRNEGRLVRAVCVAFDVMNLSGLNAALGKQTANTHYREFARIARSVLAKHGSTLVPMRTGGDEFACLAVGIDQAGLPEVLDRIRRDISRYVQEQGLGALPNPKHPGDPRYSGTGLHLGAASILPGMTAGSILNQADRAVHISKAQPNAGSPVSGRGSGDAELLREVRVNYAPGDDLETILAEARRLSGLLDNWPNHNEEADSARLLISEIFGNAARHTGGPVTMTVRVFRVGGQQWVRVEVYDTDPTMPIEKPMPKMAAGGMGIALMDEFSDRHGLAAIDLADPAALDGWRKRIWFEIDEKTGPHGCFDKSIGTLIDRQGDVVDRPVRRPNSPAGIRWEHARPVFRGAALEGFGRKRAHGDLLEALMRKGGRGASAWVLDQRATVDHDGIGAHSYLVTYLGDKRFEIGDHIVTLVAIDSEGKEWFSDPNSADPNSALVSMAELTGGTRDETVATWAIAYRAGRLMPNLGDRSAPQPDSGLRIGQSPELPLHAAQRFFRQYADPGGHLARPLSDDEHAYVAELAHRTGCTAELTWQHQESSALSVQFVAKGTHLAKHAPLHALAEFARGRADAAENSWGAWDPTLAATEDLESMAVLRDRLAAQLGVPQSALTADRLAETIAEQHYRTISRAGAVEAFADAHRRFAEADHELALQQQFREQPVHPPMSDPYGWNPNEHLAERARRNAEAERALWAQRLGVAAAPDQFAQTITELRSEVVARAAAVTDLADAVLTATAPEAASRFDLTVDGRRLALSVASDGAGGWLIAPAARRAAPTPAAPAQPEPQPSRLRRTAARFGVTERNWLEHHIQPEYPFGAGENTAYWGDALEVAQAKLGILPGLDPKNAKDPAFILLQMFRLNEGRSEFWRKLTHRGISATGAVPATPAILGSQPAAEQLGITDDAIAGAQGATTFTPGDTEFGMHSSAFVSSGQARELHGQALYEIARQHGLTLPDLSPAARERALNELRYRAGRHTAAVRAYLEAQCRFTAENLVLPYRATSLTVGVQQGKLEPRDPMQQLVMELRAKLKLNPDAANPETAPTLNNTRQRTKQGHWWDLDFNRSDFALKLYRTASAREQLKNEVITWADFLGVEHTAPIAEQVHALGAIGHELSTAIAGFETLSGQYEQAATDVEAAAAAMADGAGTAWLHANCDQVLTARVGVIDGPQPRVFVLDGSDGHDDVLAGVLADPLHAPWAQALTDGSADLEYLVVRPDLGLDARLVRVPAPRIHQAVTEVGGIHLPVTMASDDYGPWRPLAGAEPGPNAVSPSSTGQDVLPDAEVVAQFESAATRLGVPLIDLAPGQVGEVVDRLRNALAMRAFRIMALSDHVAAGSRNQLAEAMRAIVGRLGPALQDLDLNAYAAEPAATLTLWTGRHPDKTGDLRLLMELNRQEPELLNWAPPGGLTAAVLSDDAVDLAAGFLGDLAADPESGINTELERLNVLQAVAKTLSSDQDANIRIMQSEPAAVASIVQSDRDIVDRILRLTPEEISNLQGAQPNEVADYLQNQTDGAGNPPAADRDWVRLIGIDPQRAFPDLMVPEKRAAAADVAAATYAKFKVGTGFGRLMDSPEQLATARAELLAELDLDSAALDTLVALADQFHAIRDHGLFAQTTTAMINHCVPESFGYLRTRQGNVVDEFTLDPNRLSGVPWHELKPSFRGVEPEFFAEDNQLGGRARLIEGMIGRAAKSPRGATISAWVLEKRSAVDQHGVGAHGYTVTLLGKNSTGKSVFDVNGTSAVYEGVSNGQDVFVTATGEQLSLTELAGGTDDGVTDTWAAIYRRKPGAEIGVVVQGVGEVKPPPSDLRIGSSRPSPDPADPGPGQVPPRPPGRATDLAQAIARRAAAVEVRNAARDRLEAAHRRSPRMADIWNLMSSDYRAELDRMHADVVLLGQQMLADMTELGDATRAYQAARREVAAAEDAVQALATRAIGRVPMANIAGANPLAGLRVADRGPVTPPVDGAVGNTPALYRGGQRISPVNDEIHLDAVELGVTPDTPLAPKWPVGRVRMPPPADVGQSADGAAAPQARGPVAPSGYGVAPQPSGHAPPPAPGTAEPPAPAYPAPRAAVPAVDGATDVPISNPPVLQLVDGRSEPERTIGAADGIAAVSDIGYRRSRNEDAMAFATLDQPGGPVRIAVVCDGVASRLGSDRGARVAADAALAHLRAALATANIDVTQAVRDAIDAAQRAIVELSDREYPDLGNKGPASTIAIAVTSPGQVTAGWVGDSRVYLLDPVGPHSQRLTTDHTLLPALMQATGSTEAEALQNRLTNGLTHRLGRGGTLPATDDSTFGDYVVTVPVNAPRHVLVCTDGMWKDTPRADALATALTAHPGDLRTGLDMLADNALHRISPSGELEQRGTDNITGVLLHADALGRPAGPTGINTCFFDSVNRAIDKQGDVLDRPGSQPDNPSGVLWREGKEAFRGARLSGFGTKRAHANLIADMMTKGGPGALAWVLDQRTTVAQDGADAHGYTVEYLGDGWFRIDDNSPVHFEKIDDDGEWFAGPDNRLVSLAELAGGTRAETVATWGIVWRDGQIVPKVGSPAVPQPGDDLRIGQTPEVNPPDGPNRQPPGHAPPDRSDDHAAGTSEVSAEAPPAVATEWLPSALVPLTAVTAIRRLTIQGLSEVLADPANARTAIENIAAEFDRTARQTTLRVGDTVAVWTALFHPDQLAYLRYSLERSIASGALQYKVAEQALQYITDHPERVASALRASYTDVAPGYFASRLDDDYVMHGMDGYPRDTGKHAFMQAAVELLTEASAGMMDGPEWRELAAIKSERSRDREPILAAVPPELRHEFDLPAHSIEEFDVPGDRTVLSAATNMGSVLIVLRGYLDSIVEHADQLGDWSWSDIQQGALVGANSLSVMARTTFTTLGEFTEGKDPFQPDDGSPDRLPPRFQLEVKPAEHTVRPVRLIGESQERRSNDRGGVCPGAVNVRLTGAAEAPAESLQQSLHDYGVDAHHSSGAIIAMRIGAFLLPLLARDYPQLRLTGDTLTGRIPAPMVPPSRAAYDAAEPDQEALEGIRRTPDAVITTIRLGRDGLFRRPDGRPHFTADDLNGDYFVMGTAPGEFRTLGWGGHVDLWEAFPTGGAPASFGMWTIADGRLVSVTVGSGLFASDSFDPKFVAQLRYELLRHGIDPAGVDFASAEQQGKLWPELGSYPGRLNSVTPQELIENPSIAPQVFTGCGDDFSVLVVPQEQHGDGVSVRLALRPVRGEPGQVTVRLERADGAIVARYTDLDRGPEPVRVDRIRRALHDRLVDWLAPAGVDLSELQAEFDDGMASDSVQPASAVDQPGRLAAEVLAAVGQSPVGGTALGIPETSGRRVALGVGPRTCGLVAAQVAALVTGTPLEQSALHTEHIARDGLSGVDEAIAVRADWHHQGFASPEAIIDQARKGGTILGAVGFGDRGAHAFTVFQVDKHHAARYPEFQVGEIVLVEQVIRFDQWGRPVTDLAIVRTAELEDWASDLAAEAGADATWHGIVWFGRDQTGRAQPDLRLAPGQIPSGTPGSSYPRAPLGMRDASPAPFVTAGNPAEVARLLSRRHPDRALRVFGFDSPRIELDVARDIAAAVDAGLAAFRITGLRIRFGETSSGLAAETVSGTLTVNEECCTNPSVFDEQVAVSPVLGTRPGSPVFRATTLAFGTAVVDEGGTALLELVDQRLRQLHAQSDSELSLESWVADKFGSDACDGFEIDLSEVLTAAVAITLLESGAADPAVQAMASMAADHLADPAPDSEIAPVVDDPDGVEADAVALEILTDHHLRMVARNGYIPAPAPATDAAIIGRARARQPGARAELERQFGAVLEEHVMRTLSGDLGPADPSFVAEIVTVTLNRMIVGTDPIPETEIDFWLYSVADNAIISCYKRRLWETAAFAPGAKVTETLRGSLQGTDRHGLTAAMAGSIDADPRLAAAVIRTCWQGFAPADAAARISGAGPAEVHRLARDGARAVIYTVAESGGQSTNQAVQDGIPAGETSDPPTPESALAEARTGAMIALIVADGDAERLALGGAEAHPANELHLSLALLGKATDWSDHRHRAAVHQFAADLANGHGVIDSHTSNATAFNPPPDRMCVVYKLDDPTGELGRLHTTIADWLAASDLPVPPPPAYTWMPHITASWGTDDIGPLLARSGPVQLVGLRVAFADQVTDYRFGDTSPDIPFTLTDGE